jgi:hypothetical protein
MSVIRGKQGEMPMLRVILSISISAWFLTAARGQEAVGDRVEPVVEENIRQQLDKIERWGIERLLHAEKEVDQEQKRRAENSANPDELALLSRDEDSGVRFYVATNRYTPMHILAKLALDPAVHVRSGVAMGLGHSNRRDQAMVRALSGDLVQDPQVLVRLVLAQNPMLSSAIYDSLAKDDDFVVRLKVAGNKGVSPQVLSALADDDNIEVRIAALSHRVVSPVLLERHVGDPDESIRLAVAANPNAPLVVLSRLSADPSVGVRATVAVHANSDSGLLGGLIEDQEEAVLLAVASNANVNRKQLMRLAALESVNVRAAAEKRLEPLLRSEIREDILERWFFQ